MSIEVQAKSHMFSTNSGSRNLDTVGVSKKARTGARQFFHNYLHDIEGIWWIAMYSLFYTLPADQVKNNLDKLHSDEKLQQEIFGDDIFPASIGGSLTRSAFMQQDATFEANTDVLPQEYEFVVEIMLIALLRLRDFYKEIEAKLEVHFDRTQYAGFYDPLIDCFEKAEKLAIGDIRYIWSVRRQLKAQGTQKADRPCWAGSARSPEGCSQGQTHAGV